MREIPLTRGYVAFVDDDDYERLKRYSWNSNVSKRRRTVYGSRRLPGSRYSSKHEFLHHAVMNIQSDVEIDHKDGNGLNCQKKNLRMATHSENNMNKPLQSNNTSGFKGVFWIKKSKRWKACISLAGKQYHLGCFDDKTQAALAYNKKAIELFGEFAWLNEVSNE